MPLAGPPMSGALSRATTPRRSRGRAPFWRGAAGAIALAAWSVAGVFGAVLALVPVALEPGPRGRARGQGERSDEAAPRRLVPGAVPAEPLPAARAAGEAFPG